jgi:hypothetical protein
MAFKITELTRLLGAAGSPTCTCMLFCGSTGMRWLLRRGWGVLVGGFSSSAGGCIGQGGVDVDLGRAGNNALLRVEKAQIKVARRHGVIMVVNSLKAGVILFVKTFKNVGGEFLIMKRMTDGGECIREALNLVEKGDDSVITLRMAIGRATDCKETLDSTVAHAS